MADHPRITLEQWRALTAVVEAGGYAQAAEALHKTQSTLTYAVQKIERLLDLKAFEIRGRKAVLTEAGQVLYRRARTLLEEAALLERGAAAMSKDWQPDIAIGSEEVGMTGEPLMRVEFMPVAHPSHPLHKLGRKITPRDLRRHRRILIRESGPQRNREVAGVELRWTFANKASQIRALVS